MDTTCYRDRFSCDFFCPATCFPIYDYSGFRYDCAGNYGYQYSCDHEDDSKEPADVGFESSCDGNVVTVDGVGDDGHIVVRYP
ncbi:hypothetical protein L0Y65_00930, partial [Candidatus Micrarchaeota archaeon]|nr:hypothetical protein [Candidatus Micrarchaeota archaeon]